MKGVIFDLDQTIVDSAIAEQFRNSRDWPRVYALIPRFTVYKGIKDLLTELKARQYRIAIVTTSPEVYTNKVLREFGIDCDMRVCYHDVAKRKPYPDQYLKVISSLQLNLSQTYALGDRAIDIQAAHSARIKSCACYWGTNEEMRLDESNPHFKFRTVSEAMEFFEKRLH